MTVKTAFRIICLTILLGVGWLMFSRASRTIQAQEIIQQLAQNDSATTEEVGEETTESLEETAEKGIQQVKKYLDPSRVQGVIQELFSTHYGEVGEVQRINDDALTFQNPQGTTILAIDEAEVEITKADKKLSLNDIAVGDWVTVLGYKEAEDFTPKVIMVSEESPRPDTQLVVIGMITDISTKEVTLTDRATNEERTFVFTKTSAVEDADAEEAEIADFDVDVNVLLVATTTDEEKEFEVKTMRSLASLNDLN
ncbi:MAG: hypothetical protein H6773_02935 [Pseudomonadales bacterium]|nr:hypothetical protein [Pseudomonadales bacterium]